MCVPRSAANTGALKRAAMSARGGRPVGCSIVETFSKDVAPRELEEVLRLEYRSKLLNPKWAQVLPAPRLAALTLSSPSRLNQARNFTRLGAPKGARTQKPSNACHWAGRPTAR